MTVHLLRVNVNGIPKWWLCSSAHLVCGKSDWSKRRIIGLWERSIGKITKTVSYDGTFTLAEATATVAEIKEAV